MRAMLARAGIDVDVRTVIGAVNEVAQFGNFRIVVAQEPPEVSTEAPTAVNPDVRSFIVPAPALAVTRLPEGNPLATAGVISADDAGALLAITAGHAVRTGADDVGPILVGGAPARIVGIHDLTDTCLLAVTCPVCSGVGRAGVLRFAPTEHRPATFDGAASGHKTTRVRGYDLSVLDPSTPLSTKVYTDPDTIPGDSGAALIDTCDRIAGFAISRTPLGGDLEFSTWSWAAQVLASHGLDS